MRFTAPRCGIVDTEITGSESSSGSSVGSSSYFVSQRLEILETTIWLSEPLSAWVPETRYIVSGYYSPEKREKLRDDE